MTFDTNTVVEHIVSSVIFVKEGNIDKVGCVIGMQ